MVRLFHHSETKEETALTTRHLIANASLALFAALTSTAAQAYSQLVVFGDSLSDKGNTAAAVFGFLPASPYLPGRFTDGPVAVEVMARQLGLTLDDRAYGGAKTGLSNQFTTVPTLANTGMLSQVNTYTAGLIAAGHTADANALYMLWGGGNDFLAVLGAGETAVRAAGAQAVANLAEEVSSLYRAGARDFFIPTLADFAYTYYGTSGTAETRAALSRMTAGFNAGLLTALSRLDMLYSDIHIQTFDTNAALVSLRSQMATSGANLVDRCWTGGYSGTAGSPSAPAACSNPDQYFLFDNVHPTAIVHETLGLAFAAAVPEPATMGLALVGLLGVAVMGRRREAELA
jgi:phospholipase/lecithinase/hemolysin